VSERQVSAAAVAFPGPLSPVPGCVAFAFPGPRSPVPGPGL